MSEIEVSERLSDEQLSPGSIFTFVREGEVYLFAPGKNVDQQTLAGNNAARLGPNYTERGLYSGDSGTFEIEDNKIVIHQGPGTAKRFVDNIAHNYPDAYTRDLRNARWRTAQQLADRFHRPVEITINDSKFMIGPHM